MAPSNALSFENTGFESSGLRVPSLPGWLWAGALAAVADLGVAVAYWSGLYGTTPVRIPQSIASWMLGPAAFEGGTGSAVLGLVVYIAVVAAIMAAYQELRSRHVALERHPCLFGAGYGVAVYALLFHVAVPHFTAAVATPKPWHWEVTCVAAYAILVGIPSALLGRAKQ